MQPMSCMSPPHPYSVTKFTVFSGLCVAGSRKVVCRLGLSRRVVSGKDLVAEIRRCEGMNYESDRLVEQSGGLAHDSRIAIARK